MKLLSVLFLAGSVVGVGTSAWGQSIDPSCAGHLPSTGECLSPSCPSGWYLTTDQKKCNLIPSKQPKPLKCGKYERLAPITTPCVRNMYNSECEVLGYRCEDQMHPLTEKEWQELMARLKALEQNR